MKRKLLILLLLRVVTIQSSFASERQNTYRVNLFGHVISEFNLTVPLNYNHDKSIDEFTNKTKGLKVTELYGDTLNSKTFSNTLYKLIPGHTYRVRLVLLTLDTTLAGCEELLKKQHAYLAGTQGLLLARELYPNQFPIETPVTSLGDEPTLNAKRGIWGYTEVTRQKKGLWRYELSFNFGSLNKGTCILTFFDKSTKPEIHYDKYFVDLNESPSVPYGWKIVSHKKGGLFSWDPAKVKLMRFDQKSHRLVPLNTFTKQLEASRAFNANLLDFLLENPEYIPKSWQEVPNTDFGEGNDIREIYFYGTIYKDKEGHLLVRCLDYQNGEWEEHPMWLVDTITGNQFAAVRVK